MVRITSINRLPDWNLNSTFLILYSRFCPGPSIWLYQWRYFCIIVAPCVEFEMSNDAALDIQHHYHSDIVNGRPVNVTEYVHAFAWHDGTGFRCWV